MSKKDPRLIGFGVGFGTVVLVGLVAILAWGVLDVGGPNPTLVPTAVPAWERPPSSTGEDQPSPERVTPIADLADVTQPTPTPTPAPTTPPTRTAPLEYTVREGDTLFDIALAHGVSVETIQTANGLQGETILPDQVLLIPAGPLPTPTPYIEEGAIIHTVSSGESLIALAERYSVTVEMIQLNNDLDSETIQAGWKLRIPLVTPAAETSPSPTEATPDSWEPSILKGNLGAAYPLTLEGARFTMHYQPDTPADRAPERTYGLVESALEHIEGTLRVRLAEPFDVYLAGTPFAPPDQALRGRSFSSERRNFYLYDDSGTPEERRYLVTHELTHLVVWNTLGEPASVMLHEGVAVYTGLEALTAAEFVPLSHFCAAYQGAGRLPRLTGEREYLGHIRDLDLYFAAGCFVEHLIETYGLEDFKQVFTSGDFPGIYGRTLSQLESAWQGSLRSLQDEIAFDAEQMVDLVTATADGYDSLFADFAGTPAQMAAYAELDQARIAVLQARFDVAREHLDAFERALGGQ
jgi:LysM repeat protein